MRKIVHSILMIRSMNKTVRQLEQMYKEFKVYGEILHDLEYKAGQGYKNALETRIGLHKNLRALCLAAKRIHEKEFIYKSKTCDLLYNYLNSISNREIVGNEGNLLSHEVCQESTEDILDKLYALSNDLVESGNIPDLIYINNCCLKFITDVLSLLEDEHRTLVFRK